MKVCRKVAYGSGSKYYGEINSKNESHGYGCFLYANGTYYEGEWRNGKRCGKGGEVYTNQNMYVGDFLNGVRHGQGTYKSIHGVYEGQY